MATYLPVARATFSTTAFPNPLPLLTDDGCVSQSGTVASGGGVIKRGTILKKDPATNVITQPATAADCNCILSDDIDATSATVAAVVYVSGKFSAAAVIWPGALGHGVVTDALRNCDIILESVVYTDGTLVKTAPKAAEEANAKAIIDENRAKHEADVKAAEQAAKAKPAEEEEAKPADSPWAHLTAEEREKEPYLADVPAPEPPPTTPPTIPATPAPAKAPVPPPVHSPKKP